MHIDKIVNEVYTSCSWVLDGKCVVDCGDVAPLLPLLQEDRFKAVLLTHGHFDHIYGLNELCSHFPAVRVYCSEWARQQLLDAKKNISYYHESPFVFAYPDRIRVVEDMTVVDLGSGTVVTAVSTPGHTPGCITWMTAKALFTGDAYIPGYRVVTNLPHGDKRLAVQSVGLIRSLAQGRTICPGHSVEDLDVPSLKL